ncbi:MAG: STAS domain-containing protein [Armatimonadota bacterium]|nr:STAS domain-containing protein [Armatimonadota bacterium]
MSSTEPEKPTIASFVTTDAEGNRTLRILGEIDLSTCASFKSVLASASADYRGELTLDLTDVEFMDSSGLHALMEMTRELIARGGSIGLRNPGRAIYRLLEISGLLGYFHITT